MVRELKREERNGYILIMKHVDLGFGINHINGYVGVPESSTLYSRDYFHDVENLVNIHGGLTYASEVDGVWTFGFDTAHFGDDNPRIQNEEYVWNEIESLYEQLREKGIE